MRPRVARRNCSCEPRRRHGRLAQRGTAIAGAEEARRTADAERQRWSARAEALSEALDEARARAGARRLASVDGAVGALVELVQVEEGNEAAFEAAAGEALSAVLMRDEAAARRGLAHLAGQSASGAVMPLELAGHWRSPTGWESRACPCPRGGVAAAIRALVVLAGRITVGPAAGRRCRRTRAVGKAPSSWPQRPELVVVSREGDRCAARYMADRAARFRRHWGRP